MIIPLFTAIADGSNINMNTEKCVIDTEKPSHMQMVIDLKHSIFNNINMNTEKSSYMQMVLDLKSLTIST